MNPNEKIERMERYKELTTFWNGNYALAKREAYILLLEINDKLDKLLAKVGE